MLLPNKHIALSESLLGLGSLILELLLTPKDVDELYLEITNMYREKKYPSYHSYENLLLTLDFLFSLGAIQHDEKGLISKCD